MQGRKTAKGLKDRIENSVHGLCYVRNISSEVEPCVVWALRVLLPFLAKLIGD
jgi:hypothetical protein